MRRSKIKKIIIVTFSVVLVIVALVILFISPLTKYMVEKYDEEYIGRQVSMDWAYVNPFTGSLHFSNLEIAELKSDSVFFSASGFNLGFSLGKMLRGTYEIKSITLNKPKGFIIQNKNKFNFDDLIERFSSSDSDTTSSNTYFNVNNIKIKNGEFHLREVGTQINYFIKDVNIDSEGKQWDEDSIMFNFSLKSGIGQGIIKGNCSVNLENLEYKYHVIADKFDLKIIEQYLQDLTNYGTFRAVLDADLHSSGNFNDQQNVTFKGNLIINDFHFGKNPEDDYTAMKKLTLNILELSPSKNKFIFDSLIIDHPYFKYEMYDSLDNMETMFGNDGSNISAVSNDPEKFNLALEIARYAKQLARNFFESYYKISMISITNGEIIFNDYSQSEKFSMSIDPLNFYADSIDKARDKVDVNFKTGFKPYGNFIGELVINPQDSSDFDFNYSFQKLPVSMFNPYIVSFTSFPLDRGTMEINGKWKVRNGKIDSENHLLIIDPRVTEKVRSKDNSWLPMPLIMFFVRERGNVIDYDIPIKGNLKDPNFRIGDVILDVLKNIFIKPPTTPYGLEVKNAENEIEKSQVLSWQLRKSNISDSQEKFIEKIVEFLKDNPQASISIHPEIYTLKEKEHLMLFEAKKKYYFHIKNRDESLFNDDDSEKISNMSIKETGFENFLDKRIKDNLLFTIQDKCRRLIGEGNIDKMLDRLNDERKKSFLASFVENELENRVHFNAAVSKIPYNGFSFYRIEYNGEVPEFLIEAYDKMKELNHSAPRKKFLEKRKKNQVIALEEKSIPK